MFANSLNVVLHTILPAAATAWRSGMYAAAACAAAAGRPSFCTRARRSCCRRMPAASLQTLAKQGCRNVYGTVGDWPPIRFWQINTKVIQSRGGRICPQNFLIFRRPWQSSPPYSAAEGKKITPSAAFEIC